MPGLLLYRTLSFLTLLSCKMSDILQLIHIFFLANAREYLIASRYSNLSSPNFLSLTDRSQYMTTVWGVSIKVSNSLQK